MVGRPRHSPGEEAAEKPLSELRVWWVASTDGKPPRAQTTYEHAQVASRALQDAIRAARTASLSYDRAMSKLPAASYATAIRARISLQTQTPTGYVPDARRTCGTASGSANSWNTAWSGRPSSRPGNRDNRPHRHPYATLDAISRGARSAVRRPDGLGVAPRSPPYRRVADRPCKPPFCGSHFGQDANFC